MKKRIQKREGKEVFHTFQIIQEINLLIRIQKIIFKINK